MKNLNKLWGIKKVGNFYIKKTKFGYYAYFRKQKKNKITEKYLGKCTKGGRPIIIKKIVLC